jgi:hypothetical protein
MSATTLAGVEQGSSVAYFGLKLCDFGMDKLAGVSYVMVGLHVRRVSIANMRMRSVHGWFV